jgi:hypothetical protein
MHSTGGAGVHGGTGSGGQAAQSIIASLARFVMKSFSASFAIGK